MTFMERVKAILGRPFVLLLTEPMLMAITLYMSVRTSLSFDIDFILIPKVTQ